jgi:hypothetical protein
VLSLKNVAQVAQAVLDLVAPAVLVAGEAALEVA